MQPLTELGVLILDCQTTGATPALGAVLEIGWGIARASEPGVQHLQAHWVALPEGLRVHPQVRRLTGFDEANVDVALPPREAWGRLRATTDFAKTMPAAIHFAKFELAFLRDWAERFEPALPFPFEAVCVHAIACRLYPDLPRRSIRALAGFLGHGVELTRRALGHVEATAAIWRKLVDELAAVGVRDWDALGDWLAAPPPAAARTRKRRYPFPSSRYRALPDEPGVYRFLRSNGDLLYVGKAASLRKRVASHFTGGAKATERALEMLTQVQDIRVTPTRTALEAALLENEEIKSLHPPYNLQLVVGDPRTWFVTTKLDGASHVPDDVYRWGPLPSTFSVRALGAIRSMLGGVPTTPVMRARAVGAPERWAPDEAVFEAGFSAFRERHGLAIGDGNADRTLTFVARKLLASKNDDPSTDVELDDDAPGSRSWDPDRVVRHLERAAAHAYQLLQRARWLCLLCDSVVAFRERPTDVARALVVREGRIVDARDFQDDGNLVPAARRPANVRRAAFDREGYDRLRTLSSEIKRILRDGGTVDVCVGRGRWLRGDKLDAALRWV